MDNIRKLRSNIDIRPSSPSREPTDTMRLLLVLTLLFDRILLIHAHGSLKAVSVGNKEYLAWQIRRDDYDKSTPVRYSRRILNEGPVKDFTGKGITYARSTRHCWSRRLTVCFQLWRCWQRTFERYYSSVTGSKGVRNTRFSGVLLHRLD